MTVTAQPARKLISGSGWSNPLTFANVKIESASHLQVWADDVQLTLGADYSVTGVNNPAGFTVTIGTPGDYTDVDTWVLLLVPPLTQGSDVSVGGTFGQIYEDTADAIMRRVQAVNDKADRAWKRPLTYDGTEGDENDVLMIDADGNAVPGPSAAEIAAAEGYAEVALAAAALAQAGAGAPVFGTLALAQAYSPSTAPNFIITIGGSAAGDGGGRQWKKVVAEPDYGDAFSITLSGGGTAWFAAFTPTEDRQQFGSLARQPVTVLLNILQSNAEGASLGGDLTTNPNVLAYRPSTSTIVVADPTQQPFPVNNNNNYAFHAAKQIQEEQGGYVLVITVTAGATPIDHWLPGGAQDLEVMADVAAALALIGVEYVDRVLAYGGESNQGEGIMVIYRKIIELRDHYRAQNWWLDGHTYIVAPQMTQSWLNASQGAALSWRLAAETSPDIVIASSFDLVLDASPVHVGGEGLEELGHRVGRALLVPYGKHPSPDNFRYASGSVALKVAAVAADDVDFTDLMDALRFAGTIMLASNCRLTITLIGDWTIPGTGMRNAFMSGHSIKIVGETMVGAAITKGDISATPATALTYLEGKFPTRIRMEKTMHLLGGSNAGWWENILFVATASVADSGIVQGRDFAVPRGDAGSAFRGKNLAFHGQTASGANAINLNNGGGTVEIANAVFSHCDIAVEIEGGRVIVDGAVFAHASRDAIARGDGYIDVQNATTTHATALGWTATEFGRILATGAQNIGATTTAQSGVVVVT